MKRKRSETRRNEDTTRTLVHNLVSKCVGNYFSLKNACAGVLPLEIYATIMYFYKQLLVFPVVPAKLSTFNTTLCVDQIERNLVRLLPKSFCVTRGVRTYSFKMRFEVIFNATERLFIVIYDTGSVVLQGSPNYPESTERCILGALDPCYALFLDYQAWKLAYTIQQ